MLLTRMENADLAACLMLTSGTAVDPGHIKKFLYGSMLVDEGQRLSKLGRFFELVFSGVVIEDDAVVLAPRPTAEMLTEAGFPAKEWGTAEIDQWLAVHNWRYQFQFELKVGARHETQLQQHARRIVDAKLPGGKASQNLETCGTCDGSGILKSKHGDAAWHCHSCKGTGTIQKVGSPQ